jgi:hypothetical protein
VRGSVTSTAGGRGALAVGIALAVAGVAGCGGGRDATTAPASPAARTAPPAASTASTPACRPVPRATVRLIASRAHAPTRFAARSAAAVRAGSDYAVSVVAVAGGRPRVGTWLVDDLRTPRTVASATVQALEMTNWPLQPVALAPARQSGVCARRNMRGPGPLAP